MNARIDEEICKVYMSPWLRALECIKEDPADNRIERWNELRTGWMHAIHPELVAREIQGIEEGSLHESLQSLSAISFSIRDRYRLTTVFYDALYQAVARFAEEQLVREGYGSPPVPYAFVLFGSGGRKEMTPWSDQDHGVLWEDTEDDDLRAASDHYFSAWGEKVVDVLRRIGFPPCNGKVLASEMLWRGSIADWIIRTKQWLSCADWESTRYFSIALDMRTIYGLSLLEKEWRNMLLGLRGDGKSILASHQAFIRNQQQRLQAHNSFGQLIRERQGPYAGQIDIKYRLYVPIVQLVRSTSWVVGDVDAALSTKERMEGIFAYWSEHEPAMPWIKQVHANWDEVLSSRWLCGVEEKSGIWQSSGMIAPERLDDVMKGALRQSSQGMKKWLKHLERRYGHG